MDRCLFCNTDDIETVSQGKMDIQDIFKCNKCGEMFSRGVMMEVQEQYIEKQKQQKLIALNKTTYCWYEISLYDVFGRSTRPVYVATDITKVYSLVGYLQKQGYWESEIRVRCLAKYDNVVEYCGDLCVETKEGIVV